MEFRGIYLDAARVRVVATCRDDLFGRVAAIPELRRFPEKNLYTVRGSRPERHPGDHPRPGGSGRLRARGSRRCDRRGSGHLRADSGALPLVQFALTRWWEQRDRELKLLPKQAWTRIGGIEGALVDAAQTLHDALSAPDQEHMKSLMISLFRPDGTRVRVDETTITDGGARSILRKLIDRRLVRRHSDAERRVTLEVAHEALAQRWQPLRAWLEETRAERELIQELTYDAERWVGADRPAEMLWRGRRLAAARAVGDQIAGDVLAFTDRSTSQERSQRWQRRGIAIVVIGVVATVLALRYIDNAQARRDAERARDDLLVKQAAIEAKERAENRTRSAVEAQENAETERDRLLVERAGWLLDTDPSESLELLGRLNDKSMFGAATVAAEAEDRGIPLNVLTGHKSAFRSTDVRTVAVSPDDAVIASGGEDRTVRLWDANTGAHLATLTGHKGRVTRVVFSADGKWLASASEHRLDGTVRLWNLESRAQVAEMTHRKGAYDVAFSPDSKSLATAGADGAVRRWKLTRAGVGEPLEGKRAHIGVVRRLAFSGDGRWLASAGGDGRKGRVVIWEAKTMVATSATPDPDAPVDPPLVDHSAPVTALAFSPSGKEIVFGDDKGAVRWVTLSGERNLPLDSHARSVTDIAFSPDGKRVASAGRDGAVHVRSVAKNKAPKRKLRANADPINQLRFSPDGAWIATAGDDGAVRVWNVESGESRVLRGHKKRVWSVAFSANGSLLASAGADKTVRLWRVGAEHVRTGVGHRAKIWRVAYSSVGGTGVVATAAADKQIRLWTIGDGGPVLRSVLPGENAQFRRVANRVTFTPDARFLVAAAGAKVVVHDLETNKTSVLPGHVGSIRHVDLSADGTKLVSGGQDGRVLVWDVAAGKSKRIGRGHGDVRHVAFAPAGDHVAFAGAKVQVWTADGTLVWSQPNGTHTEMVQHIEYDRSGVWLVSAGDDGKVFLWNAKTGEPRELTSEANPISDRIEYVTFSPDGKHIAVAGYDERIYVFGRTPGDKPAVLEGHKGPVLKVVYSPDGRRLASTSVDQTVRVWDVASRESRVLRGNAGHPLHLAFAPGGEKLAIGWGKNLRLWDARPLRIGADLAKWLADPTE